MPEWTDKDERQHEHIKESQLERGKAEEDAQEVAALAINKLRRAEGRTPIKTTQRTSNPNASLDDRTADELHNRPAELELGIDGRSKMKKAEPVPAMSDASS